MTIDRRDFIKFLGGTAIVGPGILTSCASMVGNIDPINSLNPSLEDNLLTSAGLKYDLLISWGDKLNSKEKFGFNNDYITFLPQSNGEGILWVNHEYFNPLYVSGEARTKNNIIKEMESVGGSFIKVSRTRKSWRYVENDSINKKIDALTPFVFSNGKSIAGSSTPIGTIGNCAGGQTPWGTILTCEEGFDYIYGDRNSKGVRTMSGDYSWEKYFPKHAPEHYGWVVEIEPFSGKGKKLVSLGRFAHESATVTKAKNGNVVVYSGDDKKDEHIYKFISDSNDSLDNGTLYVASIERGEWLPLDLIKSPILQKHFKSQDDVLTYAREASKILGATPMDRPEDIEVHPKTNEVFVALTNNKSKDNYHGSIFKIAEKNDDHGSLTFNSNTFLIGGKEQGFSCPDNLAFDRNGNLWFASDISGSKIGKKHYEGLGNNALFVVPIKGPQAGEVLRVAQAPNDSEFTGLCFDDSYKSLFLSVQHPGERTRDKSNPTSTWPSGTGPKPSVVVLHGRVIDNLNS